MVSPQAALAGPSSASNSILSRSSILSRITSADPQILNYAVRVFGTTDLSEDQWKQCMDQVKVQYLTLLISSEYKFVSCLNLCLFFLLDAICLPRNAT